jgi:hypothetical protein
LPLQRQLRGGRQRLGLGEEAEPLLEMAEKIAHFPAVRDLDGFDFAAQPSLDLRQVRGFDTCRR